MGSQTTLVIIGCRATERYILGLGKYPSATELANRFPGSKLTSQFDFLSSKMGSSKTLSDMASANGPSGLLGHDDTFR